MSEGKIKIKLKNLFFSHVGTLFVMTEDSLTIEYNEHALTIKKTGQYWTNILANILLTDSGQGKALSPFKAKFFKAYLR